jgi:hypothetical protein
MYNLEKILQCMIPENYEGEEFMMTIAKILFNEQANFIMKEKR